jgi:hypothetical protein
MVTDALTVDVWYEVTDLDDDSFVFLQTDSADPCVCAFGVAEPAAVSEVGILLIEGFNPIHIPPGKVVWLVAKSFIPAGTEILLDYGAGHRFDIVHRTRPPLC